MDSPFIYLTLCSFRNRVRRRLGRLKQPRYLLGSIVGVAYLFMVFGRPFTRARRGGAPGILNVIGHSETALVVAAIALLVIVALAWWWPSSRRPALSFTRADVQFLFTAPIARWRLVRYKILRSQLGAFLGSAFVTLIMRPGSVAQAWTFWLGMALVMAIINLHLTGISLARDPDRSRRQAVLGWWLPRAVIALMVGVIAIDLVVRWQTFAASSGTAATSMSQLTRLLSTGASGIVLWPLVMLVRLPLADSPAAFAAALPAAGIALGLNYVWVLRSDASFEEASAELADKLARARTEGMAALRPRATRTPRTPPFRLAPAGRQELAVMWKNLISMGRFLSATMLVRLVPISIAVMALVTRGGRSSGTRVDGLVFVALIIAAIVTAMGPQITRADLRQDLPNLAVLKTWPMRGATLVRGQVLAPGVVLVTLAWLALVAAAIFSVNGSPRVHVPEPWTYLAAAMAIVPGLILLQLLVQNALAVTFPAWVTIGPRRGGVDVAGQRMLMAAGSILVLLLSTLPALLVAGVLFAVGRWLTGGFLIVLPAFAAAVVLLGEAFVGSELVGLILDRTDVSALDAPDA